MNKNDRSLTDEEIMLAFSIEEDHGPTTLQRYIEAHPHLAADLIDLTLDLTLSVDTEPSPHDDPNSDELQKSWAVFSRLSAERATELTPDAVQQIDASLASPTMREIGLPLSVLRAIKGGMAKLEGFPERWIAAIASAGGYATDSFRAYLLRQPRLSPSVSYKSDVAPSAGEKMTFGELIAASDLTEEQKADILREA